MSDLPADVLAAVRRHRPDIEAFQKTRHCRLDSRNAAAAVLLLADGGSVDEVARATGQPAWRVRLWATRLAAIGMEAVEAGYWPEEPRRNDVRTFIVGLLLDSPLRIVDLVAWARQAWFSREMAVDVEEREAWFVWPSHGYHVGIDANETDVEHVRTYYLQDVVIPDGAEVRGLLCGVIGAPGHPDMVNTGMEIWSFLDRQPGAIVRGHDGKTTLDG